MPIAVFGGHVLSVSEIDLATVQICLADDDSVCIDTSSLKNATCVDRGNPGDVGAGQCVINEETGEEEYFLNPDGLDDLELSREKNDVVDTFFDDCSGFVKGEASLTLAFKALTTDGTPVISTPSADPGIPQGLAAGAEVAVRQLTRTSPIRVRTAPGMMEGSGSGVPFRLCTR